MEHLVCASTKTIHEDTPNSVKLSQTNKQKDKTTVLTGCNVGQLCNAIAEVCLREALVRRLTMCHMKLLCKLIKLFPSLWWKAKKDTFHSLWHQAKTDNMHYIHGNTTKYLVLGMTNYKVRKSIITMVLRDLCTFFLTAICDNLINVIPFDWAGYLEKRGR